MSRAYESYTRIAYKCTCGRELLVFDEKLKSDRKAPLSAAECSYMAKWFADHARHDVRVDIDL